MEDTNNQNDVESSGLWAWVVTGIVLVVAVFGFYAWPKQQAKTDNQPTASNEAVDVQAQALQQLSPSDDADSIQTDIKNTDLSNIDKELDNIAAEITGNTPTTPADTNTNSSSQK